MFAHLHCHTQYSMLRGACSADELAAAARARGMRALAVTDTNGLYGAVPFYRACRDHEIKPVFGTEIVGEPDARLHADRAVILARNRRGYSELCRIITARHLSEDFDLAAAIVEASGDVVVLVDDPDLAARLLENGRNSKAGLYFEVRPAETSAQGRLRDAAARRAEQLGIALVATNDVHLVGPHQHRIHQVLRAIAENTSVESLAPEMFAGAECWLKPPDQMKRELGQWGAAVDNAAKIADECNVELELGVLHFPKFDPPAGHTAGNYLREVTYRGAEQKYGTLASVVRSRVDYELDTIIDMGYADYFLIVWDIAREAGRRCVPIVGRGSAADSIVSYVLDITRVDPIEHNLYFERFLNRQRKDPPDIDLDFCWRRRDEILQY
ncbi:MAG: PHP domain-containing protein, partial [Planctomycetes bacterium]|nr:PHP domain-containing protein [Planctomycetota bacterium]